MIKPRRGTNPIKNRFAFARQYLADHGRNVYCGQEQILSPINPIWQNITLPNTRYTVGELFIDRVVTRKIESYEELRNLGFVVVSQSAGDAKWTRQNVMYKLAKAAYTMDGLAGFPPKHSVEHDAFNKQIRIVGEKAGPLGFGPWVNTEEKRELKRETTAKSYNEDADEIMDDMVREWLNIEKPAEYIKIPELAFMITDANEIVCFPNTPDMPSILISGLKGTGKSFCMHSIIDRFFWKPAYDYKLAILNDSSRETGTWCYPNDDPDQIKILRRLNEKPLPLPLVYLHPLVKDDYEKLYMGNVGFDVTIPFAEVVLNHKKYFNLSESTRYFSQIKADLAKCKTQEEAENMLDTLSVSGAIPVNSANKIRAEFEGIFDSKLCDISSKKMYPWGVSTSPKRYNPMTACVKVGVIPSLVTEYVSTDKQLLSIYFSYFVEDLFVRQKQDPEFLAENSRVMFVLDEAHNISQKGVRSAADFLLRRCVREGRPRRIGTLLATQKFNELPDIIKDNTTYLICFKNPGEANDIANQYKLGRSMANQIKELDKHKCLAYTTEHFIVYDSNGKKRKSRQNEVFVGATLPPLSMHKRPTTGN